MPKDLPGVMAEWKAGALRSGSKTGPKVTSQKQALAIGFSEQKKLKGGSYSKGRPFSKGR